LRAKTRVQPGAENFTEIAYLRIFYQHLTGRERHIFDEWRMVRLRKRWIGSIVV
jgi:hypothetical protein